MQFAAVISLSLSLVHAQAQKPNIILIVGEGHGWASTSTSFDPEQPTAKKPADLTPNLSKIAAEGMRFSSFYASCPRCTPSRASLITGVSPTKLHMTYVNEGGSEQRGGGKGGGKGGQGKGGRKNGGGAIDPTNLKLIPPTPTMEIPSNIKTTGDVLRTAGYATAHFGKWHVGRLDPTQKGYDESDGANTNAGPGHNNEPNPEEGKLMTDRGIAFIEKSLKAKKPFFLQIDHYGGGSEAEVTPETFKKVQAMFPNMREKQIAEFGVIHDMDDQVGRLMDKLKELKISDNTYVLFTTDHGTPGGNSNQPLSGGKGSVLEGGIRVPFFVKGPGIAAGSVSKVRTVGWDLLPTFAEWAGASVPKEVEGGSLLAVLKGGTTVKRPVSDIVIHFPHYDLSNGGPATAIYQGKFKLIRNYDTGKNSLYDIESDPREQKNLIDSMPDKADSMLKAMDAYLKSVDAQMPKPNPNYKGG